MLLGSFSSYAQSELTLPFMSNIFQNTYLNPTVRSEHTFSLGLPVISSIQVQVIHNGFVPNSFLKIQDGTVIISPKNLNKQLNNENMLFFNGSIDLFHIKMRIYNWDFWYGSRQNHEVALFYPKAILSLAIEGNAQWAESVMDLSPLGLNASIYREHTFGAATERGKWVFGGRFSIFHGLTNAYLNPNKLGVSIDDDMYALSIEADATIYTSGIPGDSLMNVNFSQFGNFEDFNVSNFAEFREFLNSNYTANYLTRFRNPGYAISGGASYKLDSKTTFTFAFSDLGFISWSDSTKTFSLKGETEFNGLDLLSGALSGNGVSTDTIINDFLSNFSTVEEFDVSYRTWLNAKFYLGATYQLARRTNVGVTLYGVVNRKFYPALTVGLSQGFGRAFNLALSASMNQRTITNVGFGLIFKPGPFQIYMLADNVYTPLVDPLTFTNLNFRIGMNVVFGRVKPPQGIPYN
jgi:hypothetical protein